MRITALSDLKTRFPVATKWCKLGAIILTAVALFLVFSKMSPTSGVRYDYTKDVESFRDAAEQGDTLAQYEVGESYSRGNDIVEAYFWLSLAEKGGDTTALSQIYPAFHDDAAQLAKHLTPEQISNVKTRVLEWQKKLLQEKLKEQKPSEDSEE